MSKNSYDKIAPNGQSNPPPQAVLLTFENWKNLSNSFCYLFCFKIYLFERFIVTELLTIEQENKKGLLNIYIQQTK